MVRYSLFTTWCAGSLRRCTANQASRFGSNVDIEGDRYLHANVLTYRKAAFARRFAAAGFEYRPANTKGSDCSNCYIRRNLNIGLNAYRLFDSGRTT